MELASDLSQPATAASAMLSDRARAVIAGLLATGRAARMKKPAADEMVSLAALYRAGEFYFVSRDGSSILAGSNLDEADELQPGFVLAMARIGGCS